MSAILGDLQEVQLQLQFYQANQDDLELIPRIKNSVSEVAECFFQTYFDS